MKRGRGRIYIASERKADKKADREGERCMNYYQQGSDTVFSY